MIGARVRTKGRGHGRARRPIWSARVWFLAMAAAGGGGGGSGCSQDTVVLPSRDLDRPTDLTFACVARFEDASGKVRLVSGQPMGKCHPSGAADPALPSGTAVGDAATQFRTYAFVPNAERGDLSVVDMSYCRPDDSACLPPGARLVDLDPTSVGFGAAPLGVLPEVIAASQDGCRLVTANRGSCDLTLIDPSALLARSLDPKGELTMPPQLNQALTMAPRHSAGRLIASPGEIAFVPQQTAFLDPANGGPADGDVCAALSGNGLTTTGTLAPPVGDPAPSPGQRVPWRAVVTFPSCDLIALIELPSGNILDSYRLTADASDPQAVVYDLSPTGTAPSCSSTDCPGSVGSIATGGGDAGAGQGGAGGSPDGGPGGGAGTAGTGGGAGASAGAAGAGGTTAASAPVATAAPVQPALGLAGLAIHPEGNRVFFGAANAPAVFALDLAGDHFALPAAGKVTPLHVGAQGTVRMRLSVDPYAYSKGHDAMAAARPEYGRFVAGRHDDQPADPLEFLYVIAKDGSLRILDVAAPQPVECDVGIDPSDPIVVALNPDGSDAVRKACYPYLDAPTAADPHRLLGSGIPGHRFGSPVQDVAFANYRTPPKNDPTDPAVADSLLRVDEQMMSGAFAFAMTNAGTVYVLNIDPDLRRVSQVWRDAANKVHSDNTSRETRVFETPRPLTHSLRDFNVGTYSAGLGAQVGPPRLDSPPSAAVDGPRLMTFHPSVSRVDARLLPYASDATPPVLNTNVYFPNLSAVHPQTWRLTWEGDLTGVRISGDIVEDASSAAAPGLITTITDNGAGFCGLGGGEGDLMTLVGCDVDASCPVGDVCVHSQQVPPIVDGRSIPGMCLVRASSGDPSCERMLESFRRYEIVGSPSDSTTQVVPRRSEIPHPVYTNAAGQRVSCDPLRTRGGKSADCQPSSSPIYDGFQCVEVKARPDGSPLRDTDLRFRCLHPCAVDADCRQGRVCVAYPNDGSFCAEGAPIVPTCGLQQLFSYKLSAGNTFVMNGTVSGRTETYHTVATSQGPSCVPDLGVANLVARIPMDSPACAPDSHPVLALDATGAVVKDLDSSPIGDDAFLGKVASPFPTPDPCLAFDPQAPSPTAAKGDPAPLPVVSAVFQNTELRFVLTDLQKTFVDTLQIQFVVDGGMSPQTVPPTSDSSPGLPARIVLGPVSAVLQGATAVCDPTVTTFCDPAGLYSDLPYLFVVDQRQFAGGRLGARGQILRITPRISDTSPFAGFESFATSGRYFPIQ